MSRAIDRTGQRYGKLVVIERAPRYEYYYATDAQWLCKCDCGNETIVRAQNLVSGCTKSCGCLRRERQYLIKPRHQEGLQRGKIKLLKREVVWKDRTTRVWWTCECECGNIFSIRPNEITKCSILGCEKCRGDNNVD